LKEKSGALETFKKSGGFIFFWAWLCSTFFFSWLWTFYMYFEAADTLVVSDFVKKFILVVKISKNRQKGPKIGFFGHF